jgi:hypothetical protein
VLQKITATGKLENNFTESVDVKTSKIRVLSKILISVLLILVSAFATSCGFDPDEAVNISDCVTDEIEVKKDSTVFRFYYSSDEHPIEDYEIIRVHLEYYVDYSSLMKKKNFFLEVPDDIKFEDKTYFTVEIDDALTEESVVYFSILANQKTENNSSAWRYVLTVIIAVVLLGVLWSVYMAMCDACDSNTALPSFMWLGGLIIFGVVALVIALKWGSGPGGIMIGGAVLYFICTLFTYFKYKN